MLSVDGIQSRASTCGGAMRLGAIRHVIAHSRPQREAPAVGELRVELALEAQHEMALRAPVVGEITRGIVEQAQAHITEMPRAPSRFARSAGVRGGLDGVPVDDSERKIGDLHAGGVYLPESTAANTSVS